MNWKFFFVSYCGSMPSQIPKNTFFSHTKKHNIFIFLNLFFRFLNYFSDWTESEQFFLFVNVIFKNSFVADHCSGLPTIFRIYTFLFCLFCMFVCSAWCLWMLKITKFVSNSLILVKFRKCAKKYYCTKRRCSQIEPLLKVDIEDGREAS